MLPRDYADITCSIARTLEIVGDRWTLLILRNALVGQTRFEQFSASLALARNVLSDRLSRLSEEGILDRRQYQDRPPRYEYLVTDKGRQLWPAIMGLMQWGDRYHAPDGPPRLTTHAGCGGQVHLEVICTDCTNPVAAEAIDTRPGPGARNRTTVA